MSECKAKESEIRRAHKECLGLVLRSASIGLSGQQFIGFKKVVSDYFYNKLTPRVLEILESGGGAERSRTPNVAAPNSDRAATEGGAGGEDWG